MVMLHTYYLLTKQKGPYSRHVSVNLQKSIEIFGNCIREVIHIQQFPSCRFHRPEKGNLKKTKQFFFKVWIWAEKMGGYTFSLPFSAQIFQKLFCHFRWKKGKHFLCQKCLKMDSKNCLVSFLLSPGPKLSIQERLIQHRKDHTQVSNVDKDMV